MKTVLSKMQMYLLGTLAIVALIGSVGLNECFAAESFPTLVTTNLGQLQGLFNSEHTVAWYSVPFAKPPIDDLRWRAPQPPDAWDGVRDATEMCEACMQKTAAPMDKDDVSYMEDLFEGTGESQVFGSEDCLYMNIFRPKTAARDLPVYVFIHGGGNMLGQIAGFNGSILAEKGNMIVIFVQYRLGPLGYFSHPVLRSGNLADDSGTFGTLDNIQALKWIQEHIAAFGGNPDNVTVAGESGGGLDVMNLLISPMAKGLFHRAIVESPATLPMRRDQADQFSNRAIELLLEKDGYAIEDWNAWEETEKRAYLMAASGEDLVEICTDNILMLQPIQDNDVIPGGLAAVLRTGNYNKVPVILGTNKYEYKVLMGGSPGELIYRLQSWADLPQVLTGEITMDDLFPDQFEKDLYLMTADYGSRLWRSQAVDERARLMKEHQDDIYAYRFDWCGPEPYNFALGAAHGMEMLFFFGSDRGPYDAWTPEADPSGRKELMDIMITYLANFVATGNPNGENLPQWQQWSNAQDGPKVVLLDADDDRAAVAMSYEELSVRGVRTEITNEIAEWPPTKRLKYGMVPYIQPLMFVQLQPEQIVIDRGIFGERVYDTGNLLRKIMTRLAVSGKLNVEIP